MFFLMVFPSKLMVDFHIIWLLILLGGLHGENNIFILLLPTWYSPKIAQREGQVNIQI